jgi:transposase
VPYLHERWTAGEHSARVLWREIREQGVAASDVHVRRLVAGWPSTPVPFPTRAPLGSPTPTKPEVVYYSVHKTRWLLMKPASDLSATESAYLTVLTRLCPHLADAQQLVRSFHTILTERTPHQLLPWLERCERSGIAELVGFAQGLRRDYAAVEAAVRSPWSQGQTEGQINRLKLLKRQMYGRSGFDLLRRRVLRQQACAP